MTRLHVSFAAAFAVATTMALGCGGRVEQQTSDGSSSSETNLPADVPSGSGCERACRLLECGSQSGYGGSCLEYCEKDFYGNSSGAQSFASCLEALGCNKVQEGLQMDYGPIGACYNHAHEP